MKNIKTLGIIAMVAIITFGMVACGDGGGGKHTHKFSGEWFGDETGHWQLCPDDREKGPVESHTAGGGICLKCGYNSPIVSVDALATYLGSVSGGANANDPIELKVAIELGDGSEADSGWQELLAALDTAGKFVDLDLSDCTMTGTEFTGNDWDTISDGMDKIVSIALPDSVTTIGNGAFYDCTGLTITINAKNIGTFWFSGCTGLTSITIPDSVTEIGGGAFNGCSGLTSVTIGSGVTNIGSGAFNGCTGLTSVTIPAGVTSIGISAFTGCTGLTSVTFQTGSNITETNFGSSPFPGDLRDKYFATGGAGGAGTYTRSGTAPNYTWAKQN